MSGLIRGKIECVVPTSSTSYYYTQNVQAIFTNLYNYFTSHPNYTLIASFYGATSPQVPGGTAAGLGTGFWNNPNGSWGFNAFFVVRANATATRPYDVYHMFQWAGPTNYGSPQFGATAGTTALIQGSSTINGSLVGSANGVVLAHAAAIGIGGSGGSSLSPLNGNPWRGTSAANGADTKASTGPIWGAPSGGGTGVIIFPRSNNNHGGTVTLAQNMTLLVYWTGQTGIRYHIIGDDDSWILTVDYSDGNLYNLNYSGLYQPRTNLSIPYPYVVIDGGGTGLPLANNYTFGDVYGSLAGTTAYEGGIVNVLTGSSAGCQVDHYSVFNTQPDFWPNKQWGTSPGTFDMLDIPVGIYEIVGGQNQSGILGQIDFFREVYNVPTNGVLSDYSRLFVGANAVESPKYAIPWDKETKTIPRSGDTLQGYNFVAPSLSTLT
jgi:hypothetical protein